MGGGGGGGYRKVELEKSGTKVMSARLNIGLFETLVTELLLCPYNVMIATTADQSIGIVLNTTLSCRCRPLAGLPQSVHHHWCWADCH